MGNGRLYSADGTFAFVSINGSKFIYSNENVVRYNGHYAFQDELIVFACKFQGVLSERSSKKRQFEIAKKVLKEDDLSHGSGIE